MKRKIYFILAVMISLMPFSVLRISLYKIIFKYKIKVSKIGWLCIINIDELKLENATLLGLNIFTGPFSVELKSANRIGSFNYFKCGTWATSMECTRRLILEEESRISNQHFFDVFGTITIGKKSIIAGVRSQFWTHGGLSSDVDITIGNNCYIGSGVKFAPGTAIPDDSLCALGSVITKKFYIPNVLIGGVPAKIIKEQINWRENWH